MEHQQKLVVIMGTLHLLLLFRNIFLLYKRFVSDRTPQCILGLEQMERKRYFRVQKVKLLAAFTETLEHMLSPSAYFVLVSSICAFFLFLFSFTVDLTSQLLLHSIDRAPTAAPSVSPTVEPSAPTPLPTKLPSAEPSLAPTNAPTNPYESLSTSFGFIEGKPFSKLCYHRSFVNLFYSTYSETIANIGFECANGIDMGKVGVSLEKHSNYVKSCASGFTGVKVSVGDFIYSISLKCGYSYLPGSMGNGDNVTDAIFTSSEYLCPDGQAITGIYGTVDKELSSFGV